MIDQVKPKAVVIRTFTGSRIYYITTLNGKSIYAKVLEAIPQMKQNAGLIIKLSDSAISALGTNEAKFYCELSYEN